MSADNIWKNMRSLKDKGILEPIKLLKNYPEPVDCKEKNKKDANCYAKHFLNDYKLQFGLQQTHHLFKAAHFFKDMIDT